MLYVLFYTYFWCFMSLLRCYIYCRRKHVIYFFGIFCSVRHLGDFKYLFGLDDVLPKKVYMPRKCCLVFSILGIILLPSII